MIRRLVLIAVLCTSGAGCTGEPEKAAAPPPEPMATTGSDQVVIFVPTMLCESCPGKVAEGLALLPWVDAESIQPDRKKQQVRFRVKDKAAFDPDAVKDTVSRKGFKGVQILVNPT